MTTIDKFIKHYFNLNDKEYREGIVDISLLQLNKDRSAKDLLYINGIPVSYWRSQNVIAIPTIDMVLSVYFNKVCHLHDRLLHIYEIEKEQWCGDDRPYDVELYAKVIAGSINFNEMIRSLEL